jgi:hypothetical protein
MKDFITITHACWLADRIPNVTAHFPPTKTTPTSRRTTARLPMHG